MPEAGGIGEFHGRLLENLSTAVVVLDEQLCIRYVNPAAEQLLATSASHLAGQSLARLFEDTNGSATDWRHALRDQRPHTRREARLRLAAARPPVLVDYTVTPVADSRGRSQQLVMELQPVERLLRSNLEDSLSAANQATHALVRGMAHEVRNPLGGIRGAAQLLARALDDPELREYMEIIISETDRLRNLVDRMLGPRKPPDFGWINIHQVLERVRIVVQAETGAALSVQRDYDPSLPELWADMDQLIQVMLNILRNAAQALLDDPAASDVRRTGTPRVVIRTRVLRQFTIRGYRHRLVCMTEIEDNGPGIDEQLRKTLFYPMVTGRGQGSGFGLPIAQSIMQQLGGLIECDSTAGRTVFRVLIPFAPAPDARKEGL